MSFPNKNTKSMIFFLFVAGILFNANQVFAYDAGSYIVRGGITTVNPNDDSKGTSGELDNQDPVEVESGVGFAFSGTYMYSETFGVELLLALPFTHDLEGSGIIDGVAVGETKHLPPTLSAQYYPPLGHDKLNVYFGLGLNYTTFFSEDVDSELEAGVEDSNLDLSLDDSIGLAVEAGVDYQLDDNLMLSAGIWYINIETSAEVKGPEFGKTEIDVEINPVVMMLGLGYKF